MQTKFVIRNNPAGVVLEASDKSEMGYKMQFKGKIKEKLRVVGIFLALMFAFGTSAQAAVTASPTTVNFGTQVVGITSLPKTVTLTNTGWNSITISTASTSAAQFSYSGISLPVTLKRGQSLIAAVKFAPTAAQSYAGTLSFTESVGTKILISLTGTGSLATTPPSSYTINATPSSFSFAYTSGGTAPASQSVLINDTTLGPLPFTLSADQPWIVLSAKSGTTKATLQFGVNPTGLAAGSYSGHVFISASGVANSPLTVPVTLIVKSSAAVAPAITTQPVSKTVTAGQTATFSVTATGTAPMTYQWKKNGATISGATSSAYTTAATTTSDNTAQFTVAVANSAGTATSTAAILTVNAATTYKIYATPTSLSFSAKVGDAASTQSININDTTPGPLPFTLSVDQPWITISTTSSSTQPGGVILKFGVKPANLAAGTYSGHVNLVASGVSNSPFAIPVTLTVTSSAAVAPAISTQPASKTVTAGQTATFSVTATGTAPMTYQWKKSGAAIGGATSSTYTTPATTTSDNAAQFTVAVTNSAGTATSTAATLTVSTAAVAPTISTQPASKTVTAGQTATFTVAATGTAPMTYQWKKGGAAISGATSSTYTTPAETTSDNAAQFTVAVTNSAGTATSTAATLTVTAATVALNASATALNFGSVTLSTSSSKSVTLTNAGNSNITISNVSVSGAGFNASGVSTGQILTPGQTATLSATFTPSSTGSVTGGVTISSNASADTIALSGSGVAAVSHSVALSWTASTSTVTGYNTYSSNVSGGPYTKVNPTVDPTTTYTDNTVQAGKTYYYVVTAVDSSNMESPESSEISATIP